MELLNPSNFKAIVDLFTSLITGLVALVGVYYGVQTFFLAKETKEEWINQKKFDYRVTVDSLLFDYLTTINDIYYFSYNYTNVFLKGSSSFQNKGQDIDAISNSNEYVKRIIDYVNHTQYSKTMYGQKLSDIYDKLHPAVVGLDDPILKKIFYDIQEFKKTFDWQIENSQIKIRFLLDCYNQKGTINLPYVDETLKNSEDYIDNKAYQSDLKKIRISVKEYLSKKQAPK